MKKKIIHIAENSVFLEESIRLFEKALPNRNVFFLNKKTSMHKNFDYSNYSNLIEEDYNSEKYNALLKKAQEKYFLCILHNIGGKYKSEIVSLLQGKVFLHGICWGWELYKSKRLLEFLYQPYTLNVFQKIFPEKKKSIKRLIKENINYCLKGSLSYNKYYNVLHKLDSYSTIIKSESLFMEQYYGYKKKHFDYIYPVNINELNRTGMRIGRYVQVGNSAAFENNHLDALPYLKKIKYKVDGIVLPLSYGGNNEYLEIVQNEYISEFNDRCVFLRQFMSLNDYNTALVKCGFILMNHTRQQAMNNIFIGLYQGAKIFFNNKSMVYKELKSLGYKVYNLEELERETEELENQDNVETNRSLVMKHRSFSSAINQAKEIINYYS